MTAFAPWLRRLAARARAEVGWTLVELLVTMVLLSILLAAVTSVYISGSNTQTKLNAEFNAQTALHVALDKLRKDVHLSCGVTAQSATSVTLSGTPCDGTNVITWCTQGSGSAYSLFRVSGSTCTGGVDYGDYLTGGSVFSYLAANTPAGSYSLPRLHIDTTLNATPSSGSTNYRIVDDIALYNGVRQ